MTISTIKLAIIGVLEDEAVGVGGGGVGARAGGSPTKDEGILKKWLDRLAHALKRLAGKAVEVFPAIVGSAVGAILSFVGKAVRSVAKQTYMGFNCFCCRTYWLVVDAKS